MAGKDYEALISNIGRRLAALFANILRSEKLPFAVVIIFFAQASYFILSIPFGIPSDEIYHYSFIEYYASRSFWTGPIIQEQIGHFSLGDIQRTPSYLYHYLLSFILRFVTLFSSDRSIQVFCLRMVSVLLGVGTLLVLIAILKRLELSQRILNLVLIASITTGMFVWVFTGINYDSLAIFLFFCLLYLQLRILESTSTLRVLAATLVGMLLLLTKQTYLPVIGVSFLLLTFFVVQKAGLPGLFRRLARKPKPTIRVTLSTVVICVLVIFNMLCAGLVIERYFINLANYHSISPACDRIHTAQECVQNSVYDRNTGQKQQFDAYKQQGGKLATNPVLFTWRWLVTMFGRSFYFRGNKSFYPTSTTEIVAIVEGIIALFVVLLGRKVFKKNKAAKFVTIITLFYIITVFLYNAQTYVKYGYEFAFQGRYLMPVLPFVYLYLFSAMKNMVSRLSRRNRTTLTYVLYLIMVINLIEFTPLIIYAQQTLR